MPLNSKGDYSQNPQRGRAMENAPRRDGVEPKGPPSGQDGGQKTHTITDNGDGTFHSKMHDGTETDHPHHMHLMAHIGHHATGGDKHHIAHHDGMSHHSHGVHESGEHDGPHDHENLEDLKGSLGKFFNEEEGEGKYWQGEHDGEKDKISGGY